MTVAYPPTGASVFDALQQHPARPEAGGGGWAALPGASGASGADGQVQLTQDPAQFLRGWMHHRHPEGGREGLEFVLGVGDRTRIWSAKLLSHLEEAQDSVRRSRIDLMSPDTGGGVISVNHLMLGEEAGAALHLYSAEVRVLTPQAQAGAQALLASCDFLLQFVGPMRSESLTDLMAQVHLLLQTPGGRLRAVIFVASPSAAGLQPQLKAFGQPWGGRVRVVQANLADSADVWRRGLRALEHCIASSGGAQAPAARPSTSAMPLTDTGSDPLQGVLQGFAATEGTVWVALLHADGHALLTATLGDPGSALHEAGRVAQILGPQQADADEAWMFEDTTSVVVALQLGEPVLRIAARFDQSQVQTPMARLLVARMRDELDRWAADA
jgi:hypothetical protein